MQLKVSEKRLLVSKTVRRVKLEVVRVVSATIIILSFFIRTRERAIVLVAVDVV